MSKYGLSAMVLVITATLGIVPSQNALASGKLAINTIVKSEPPRGMLAFGQVVLVDDGSCGPGKIKKLTGGNGSNIPRKKECIAHH